MIDLQIFVSKRGTRVVRATDLYRVLDLPAAAYAANMRRWLKGVYEFHDGLRKPVIMRDFARRKVKEPLMEDYYLTLEFAKLLCLRSGSRHTLKCARYLGAQMRSDGSHRRAVLRELQVLINLVRAMSKLSNQIACERKHAIFYQKRHNGRLRGWWAYRKRLFSIGGEGKVSEPRSVLEDGKPGKASLRARLLARDPAELIRWGIADWLLARGQNPEYAMAMASLGKEVAQLLKVEIEDDRPAVKALNLFSQVG